MANRLNWGYYFEMYTCLITAMLCTPETNKLGILNRSL